MYGDGLFETMVSTNERVILLNEHLNRLNKGLDYLGIDLQSSRKEWRRLFIGIRKNGHLGTQHVVRCNVGGMGEEDIQVELLRDHGFFPFMQCRVNLTRPVIV